MLTPGVAGPPDSGVITVINQSAAMAGGMPLAVVGSSCQMINSVSGVPYMLPISTGGSTGVTVNNMALIRMGDQMPAGPGMLLIIGPPAAPFINDQGAP